MFRVPTFVAPSPIAGVGVFTAVPISSGSIVWEFTPGVDLRLHPSVVEGTPEPLGTLLRHYCYEEPDGTLVLCGDNARFMNHAVEPNCDDDGGGVHHRRPGHRRRGGTHLRLPPLRRPLGPLGVGGVEETGGTGRI